MDDHGYTTIAVDITSAKIRFDVADKAGMHKFLELNPYKPDIIIHLAAMAFPPCCKADPELCNMINAEGTRNLLEVVHELELKPRFVFISTSQVYLPSQERLSELSPTWPLNPTDTHPYPYSKILAEHYTEQLCNQHGLEFMILRPFNHIGPGQQPLYICSEFGKKIAEIASGMSQPTITVGDLSIRRDYTDVRDVVRAYRLALEHLQSGQVYNICSGDVYSGQQILDTLVRLAGLSHLDVTVDQSKVRQNGSSVLQGDSSKFQQLTGWHPEIPFEQTLKDILDYWAEKTRQR